MKTTIIYCYKNVHMKINPIQNIYFFDSEGINVNKLSASKECDIYHQWYSLNYIFKFQPNFCNAIDVMLY